MKKTTNYRTAMAIFLYLCVSLVYAVEEGTLTVITDPEGVEVWLDDNYMGESPVQSRKLKAGRYTVKMVDQVQQVSASEEVYIKADQETVVEKTLKAKFGTLKVESDPPGADVTISTSLGKTPLENNFMNPGKYHIEIEHPKKSYQPVTAEIVIPQGKKVELTNTLVKQSRFDKIALVRLLLGAGAAAGYIWAIIEQGDHKEFESTADIWENTDPGNPKIQKYRDQAHSAAVMRTLGIVGGSICLIGLEIVAFF
jgi:hypothetical protein